ncbi:MAG: Unknown protein [uncultured Thiotrichaceae bacterium]|uniref:HPt domain-containing protein n=1 Tax=uncultured Thiotrichaceae bacterium TaxID=298394 RepID=A0A6S6SDV5_9GAMM|nr:MAG: Unknown protein [uncultured Thiotrichaceae bacterium]
MSKLSINPIDMDTYSQLEELMGDEGFQEIIDFFMLDTHKAMKSIPHAINHQHSDHVGAICHKLKSSCKLLGAFTMAELCGLLEAYKDNKDDLFAAQTFLKLEAEFQRVEQQLKEEMIVEL